MPLFNNKVFNKFMHEDTKGLTITHSRIRYSNQESLIKWFKDHSQYDPKDKEKLLESIPEFGAELVRKFDSALRKEPEVYLSFMKNIDVISVNNYHTQVIFAGNAVKNTTKDSERRCGNKKKSDSSYAASKPGAADEMSTSRGDKRTPSRSKKTKPAKRPRVSDAVPYADAASGSEQPSHHYDESCVYDLTDSPKKCASPTCSKPSRDVTQEAIAAAIQAVVEANRETPVRYAHESNYPCVSSRAATSSPGLNSEALGEAVQTVVTSAVDTAMSTRNVGTEEKMPDSPCSFNPYISPAVSPQTPLAALSPDLTEEAIVAAVQEVESEIMEQYASAGSVKKKDSQYSPFPYDSMALQPGFSAAEGVLPFALPSPLLSSQSTDGARYLKGDNAVSPEGKSACFLPPTLSRRHSTPAPYSTRWTSEWPGQKDDNPEPSPAAPESGACR